MPSILIRNIGKLYTLAGLDGTSGQAASNLEPIENAELEVLNGEVSYAGPSRTSIDRVTRSTNPYPKAPGIDEGTPEVVVVDARGALVTPGLVDPHTHAIYGGNRASELPLKLAGVPYLDILTSGGGILSTVRSTRAASDEELLEATANRLMAMLENGTTTAEVKSGYGLSVEQELRLLRLIGGLGDVLPITLVATFMGAHAVPEEFRDVGAEAYVDEVVDRMLPAVQQEGLAAFCDVFCESGVFSISQSRRLLDAARGIGMAVKIHADEIETGDQDMSGAELAAELGAVSADHLRETGPAGFRAMKDAGVTPVVLPATSFCLRDHRYAHARTMIDEFDLPVALATDCNPGTSPTESLQMAMALAALELKMTPEEILAGVTINASRAIGMEREVGSLESGKQGDAVIWQAYDLDMLPYRFGSNQVAGVVKAGDLVFARFD